MAHFALVKAKDWGGLNIRSKKKLSAVGWVKERGEYGMQAEEREELAETEEEEEEEPFSEEEHEDEEEEEEDVATRMEEDE